MLLVDDEGIRKYILRGKDNLADAMSDFYVTGNGFVSDYISPNTENAIPRQIAEKKNANDTLNIKLEELRQDGRFSNEQVETISSFNNDNTWRSYICDHYEPEIVHDTELSTEEG